MKHPVARCLIKSHGAAAFGRLCVETCSKAGTISVFAAAAFGRLCVETDNAPPATHGASAAAFGRLCVETAKTPSARLSPRQPPSGGCVLKPLIPISTRFPYGSRLRAAVC